MGRPRQGQCKCLPKGKPLQVAFGANLPTIKIALQTRAGTDPKAGQLAGMDSAVGAFQCAAVIGLIDLETLRI